MAKSEDLKVNINVDSTPILYTDNIYMTTNDDGLVINVCQRVANTNQMHIVSRVGMSRTHAKKFLAELGKLLAVTEGQKQTGDKN